MDFDFNEEQYMLRDSVRAFLDAEWGPAKARLALETFDEAFWARLCELGLQGLLVPEAHGGSGLGITDLVMVLEEFGRSLVPPAMVETILASEVIARFGTNEQRSTLLPEIAAGTARIAFAHAEPDKAHFSVDLATKAVGPAGVCRLNGRKMLVPCAAAATHFLVSAVHQGARGLYLCKAGEEGLELRAHTSIDPGCLVAELTLRDVMAVPVGSPGDTASVERLVETSTFAAAAQMLGVSATALDLAVRYSKERIQFGKPIGSFQAIKHKCADMLVDVECARTAVYYGAWALTGDEPELALAVSMAKAVAGDTCAHVCADTLQVHGGVGFTWEFDVHLYLRRGKFLECMWGDATAHRERVAVNVLDVGKPEQRLESRVAQSTAEEVTP